MPVFASFQARPGFQLFAFIFFHVDTLFFFRYCPLSKIYCYSSRQLIRRRCRHIFAMLPFLFEPACWSFYFVEARHGAISIDAH